MLRIPCWRGSLIVFAIGVVLMLSIVQSAHARSFGTHRAQATCQVSASEPKAGERGQVTSTSSIECSNPVSDIQVTSRLEVNVGGSWYKLSESSTSGPANAKSLSSVASAACTQGQTMTFRSVASGSYQDKEWHQVPARASSEVALQCTSA